MGSSPLLPRGRRELRISVRRNNIFIRSLELKKKRTVIQLRPAYTRARVASRALRSGGKSLFYFFFFYPSIALFAATFSRIVFVRACTRYATRFPRPHWEKRRESTDRPSDRNDRVIRARIYCCRTDSPVRRTRLPHSERSPAAPRRLCRCRCRRTKRP